MSFPSSIAVAGKLSTACHPLLAWSHRNKFPHSHSSVESRCFSKNVKCLHAGSEKDSQFPLSLELCDVKLIYAVAPALARHQELYPESSSRVRVIMDSLQNMDLTPKGLGHEVKRMERSTMVCERKKQLKNELSKLKVEIIPDEKLRSQLEVLKIIKCLHAPSEKDSQFPLSLELCDVKLIYAVAPALARHQELHPESSSRVRAIMDSLQKRNLTPKGLGHKAKRMETSAIVCERKKQLKKELSKLKIKIIPDEKLRSQLDVVKY